MNPGGLSATAAPGCGKTVPRFLDCRSAVMAFGTVRSVPAGSLQIETVTWVRARDAETGLRFGLGRCNGMLVDTPDYTGGVDRHGPRSLSDVALAIKHQLQGLQSTGLQLSWIQDLDGGWLPGSATASITRASPEAALIMLG